MNQIYLGHRSYGFSVAARTYFAKPLSEISLGEAAVLAGIPKAPSVNNPRTNLKGALNCQHYVLGRMLSLGYISQEDYDAAKAEKITTRSLHDVESEEATRITQVQRQGQYVAELARQLMYLTYKDNVYGRGLNVYTTVVPRIRLQPTVLYAKTSCNLRVIAPTRVQKLQIQLVRGRYRAR
ncbi:hypothetical protein OURE66S_04281 [Oligella ureolytica]